MLSRAIAILMALALPALPSAQAAETDTVLVKVAPYPDNYKADGMWAGLYVSEAGLVYSGLCTHGGSALFYEYDPVSGINRLVADIGELVGDNGTGERTQAKIHTRFAEDGEGRIYFATGNQGAGPSRIDPSTYYHKGSHLMRYTPSTGLLEDLGQVNSHFGSYGLVIDRTRKLAYLSCWNNHIYQFDIENLTSRDLGRVSNWDVNRMIVLDGGGNLYGTSANHWIWKYDVEADRIVELPLQVPHDQTIQIGYQRGHPALDRRHNWRYVQWDPVNEKIYGIECGRSLLFEFDPGAGQFGATRLIADMALETHRAEHRFPYATLAVGLVPGKAVYYGIVNRTFDYSAEDNETQAETRTYLKRCNLASGQVEDLGMMFIDDGRLVLGMGACEVADNGRVYLCGAIEEHDVDKIAGKAAGVDPYSLQLFYWDPPEQLRVR